MTKFCLIEGNGMPSLIFTPYSLTTNLKNCIKIFLYPFNQMDGFSKAVSQLILNFDYSTQIRGHIRQQFFRKLKSVNNKHSSGKCNYS